MTNLLQRFFHKRPVDADPCFWQWFRETEDRLFHVEDPQDDVLALLGREMDRVARGLTFELGPVDDGRRELVVSADGIRERFPDVQRLVSSAPPLDRWTVTAFRQRKPPDLWRLELNGECLDHHDVWFQPAVAQGHIHLTLFVRGLRAENKQTLQGATFLLLDCALGEFDVEQWIGELQWAPLPIDPVASGLHPFSDLPQTVDSLKLQV